MSWAIGWFLNQPNWETHMNGNFYGQKMEWQPWTCFLYFREGLQEIDPVGKITEIER